MSAPVALTGPGGAKHLHIDGGRTIQSFLAARPVEGVAIATIPVLLGVGRLLFGPVATRRDAPARVDALEAVPVRARHVARRAVMPGGCGASLPGLDCPSVRIDAAARGTLVR